jgi:hypothetical protein
MTGFGTLLLSSHQIQKNLLSVQEEEQLTKLQCDQTLKIKFTEVSPDVFWISI